MHDFTALRRSMIEEQLQARGLDNPRVLDAVMAVPRELFVPEELVEFAYEDTPLPIAAGQTISQPYIVALMASALELHPDDRVLEVGTGSGYAAAVLSRLARRVYTIERHEALADAARQVLERLGLDNVEVRHGDGTRGWPEQAPFQAIVVAAGSPTDIPAPLQEQLAVGGHLVIPSGGEDVQKLWRLTRTSVDDYRREDLGNVRFVPLIGRAGWVKPAAPEARAPEPLPRRVARHCEPFTSIEEADLDGLMGRIGDARLVLLGEASHGTAEFYDMRARITRRLIEDKGFDAVAVEADWPDAAVIDGYVHDAAAAVPAGFGPFARFPTWMWANRSVLAFVRWLHDHNARADSADGQVGFYGLDLYSMYESIESVLGYLDDVDPDAARIARERYGCLMPWSKDPAGYGRVALNDRYRACEEQVLAMLRDLEDRRLDYVARDGLRFFHAAQNARLIHDAERYYRTMYYGSRPSWNLRDQHMFDTLEAVLAFRGEQSARHGHEARAVVWAHNSHLGDARATEMAAQGEHNVGQLVRERYGDAAYLVGFGTDHGTVTAATHWSGAMKVKNVRPALAGSYEHVCHESRVPGFLLPLRDGDGTVREGLLEPRLERAIGVIYRPESERQSHYFQAVLPEQFDEYVFFDETRAVEPLPVAPCDRPPDTFPFGL